MPSIVKNQKGLSVLELIIVLSIIAILIYFTFIFYSGISVRAHDAVRLADMANLQQAIQIAINESQEKPSYTLCSSVVIPCSGSSFPMSDINNKPNGKGWLKVDFENYTVSNFTTLPTDPINNEKYHYEYFSDGLIWELTTKLESKEYKSKMADDGGKDPEKYEIMVKVAKPKIRKTSE